MDEERRRQKIWIARGVIVLSVVLGGIYYVWRMKRHALDPGDEGMTILVGFVFMLPICLVIMMPAFLLVPRIIGSDHVPSRIGLSLGAAVPLVLGILIGGWRQWGDWDEFLIFVIPTAPVLLMLAWTSLPLPKGKE